MKNQWSTTSGCKDTVVSIKVENNKTTKNLLNLNILMMELLACLQYTLLMIYLMILYIKNLCPNARQCDLDVWKISFFVGYLLTESNFLGSLFKLSSKIRLLQRSWGRSLINETSLGWEYIFHNSKNSLVNHTRVYYIIYLVWRISGGQRLWKYRLPDYKNKMYKIK